VQPHGAECRLHDQRGGGVDVEAGPERTVGDARLMMSLISSCTGESHARVLAWQRLGQVVVVVGQAAIDPVLGGSIRRVCRFGR